MLLIGPEQTITQGKDVWLAIFSSTMGTVKLTYDGNEDNYEIGPSGDLSVKITFRDIGTYTVIATKALEEATTTVHFHTDKCKVKGSIRDVLGVQLRDSEVDIEPIGNSHISAVAVKAYTDAYGFFAIPLLRGITVNIIAKQAAYRKQILVPDQDEIDLREL